MRSACLFESECEPSCNDFIPVPSVGFRLIKKSQKAPCSPNLCDKIMAAMRSAILKDSCNKIEVNCGFAKIKEEGGNLEERESILRQKGKKYTHSFSFIQLL